MPVPHAEKIRELSLEEIASLQPWELLDLAIPRGKRQRVAENIGVPYPTLASWWKDPQDGGGTHDANGRRGLIYEFVSLILAVYAQSPDGAWLIHKWLECQLAEADSIQGRDKLIEALRVADEARTLAERIIEITGGPARNKP